MTEVVYSSLVSVNVEIRGSVHLPHGRGQTDLVQYRYGTASTPERAMAEAAEAALTAWGNSVALTLAASEPSGEHRFYADDEPWLVEESDTFDADSDVGWTGALIDSVGDTWLPLDSERPEDRFESWIVLDRRREVRSYRELSFPVTIAPPQWEMN